MFPGFGHSIDLHRLHMAWRYWWQRPKTLLCCKCRRVTNKFIRRRVSSFSSTYLSCLQQPWDGDELENPILSRRKIKLDLLWLTYADFGWCFRLVGWFSAGNQLEMEDPHLHRNICNSTCGTRMIFVTITPGNDNHKICKILQNVSQAFWEHQIRTVTSDQSQTWKSTGQSTIFSTIFIQIYRCLPWLSP